MKKHFFRPTARQYSPLDRSWDIGLWTLPQASHFRCHMVVWTFAWSRLNRVTIYSRSCLSKPCWIAGSGGAWAKVLTIDPKWEAVVFMCNATDLSRRRACRLTDVSLSTWCSASGCWFAFIRTHHWASTWTQALWLSAHLAVTASGGLQVNHMRIYRIYRLNGPKGCSGG